MNVVVLSTYPPDDAAHGGQHRLKNIIKEAQALGHSVRACGILGSDGYTIANGYLKFPSQDLLRKYIDDTSIVEDWAVGQLVGDNDQYFEFLRKKIGPKPDYIIVEQPWLFNFAKRYVNQIEGTKPKIIYDSQNIEHELKYSIMERRVGREQARDASTKIRNAEVSAIQNADFVSCVSSHDHRWIAKYTSRDVVLAPNGVASRRCTFDDLKRSNTLSAGRKFSLYCASGHPPNIDGFFDLFSEGIGGLSPEHMLIIAGGAGPVIANDRRFSDLAGLHNKFAAPGFVSESQLRGLLATAQVIILPIRQGGGTNLKTAEALWSGRPIVATSSAMRGFEEYRGHENVYVEDESVAFVRRISILMQNEPSLINEAERSKRAKLLWSQTLSPLVNLIK
jgi:glycosyltransferase involved in cell wall biosynthesis